MNCNHKLQSFAYIVDSLNDDAEDIYVDNSDNKIYVTSNRISIEDYMYNSELQKKIKNEEKYIICENKHKLTSQFIGENPDIRNYTMYLFNHCESKNVHNESKWHLNWKKHFKNTEVTMPENKDCIKRRRPDAIVHNKSLEFQHSRIHPYEVSERNEDHAKNDYNIHWIIDCTDGSISVTKLNNSYYLLKFINNRWKYINFLTCDYIYLDFDELIYKVDPKKIIIGMIYICDGQFVKKGKFIKSFTTDEKIWDDDIKIPQCTIYVNQRGAGCGKTYESIQLLNNENNKFIEKTTFVYLTKAHTAKKVIYDELVDQEKKGKLSNIEIDKLDEDEDLDKKHYCIYYKNNTTKQNCKIIMATIDSFIYNILINKKHNENDAFYGMVKSIMDNKSNIKKNLKLGGEDLKLCKETLIIIDEAQDLYTEYLHSIGNIMAITHMDVYIIGDKLQSIWYEDNIFTYLEDKNNKVANFINIERSAGRNCVMRFHNKNFIPFVNNIIDFKKRGLPEIDSICNGGDNCNYKPHSINTPHVVFEMENIYENTNTKKIDNILDKIKFYMETEIKENNYLPNNFLFIFPFLTKNVLASKVENMLQDFWKTKFTNDTEYCKKVINDKTKYKTIYEDKNNYVQYVYFHKSNEGKSINLNESNHATRILSIHASKGMGCEVVFLLGISERSLHFYTNETGSLKYESLLHVAITRQKKQLYIGVSSIGCDIYNKFTNIEVDSTIEPKIFNIGNPSFSTISNYGFINKFNKLNKKFEIINKMNNICESTDFNKKIIEWGHHTIRYAVFVYEFLVHIHNNENCDNDRDQFKTIMREISSKKIKLELYNEYRKHLNILSNIFLKIDPIEKAKHREYFETIPILYFESHVHTSYHTYKNFICTVIEKIQTKIKNSIIKNKLPILCPLETVILLHIREIIENGNYSEININEIDQWNNYAYILLKRIYDDHI
jgi:hypothetical protein